MAGIQLQGPAVGFLRPGRVDVVEGVAHGEVGGGGAGRQADRPARLGGGLLVQPQIRAGHGELAVGVRVHGVQARGLSQGLQRAGDVVELAAAQAQQEVAAGGVGGQGEHGAGVLGGRPGVVRHEMGVGQQVVDRELVGSAVAQQRGEQGRGALAPAEDDEFARPGEDRLGARGGPGGRVRRAGHSRECLFM